MSVYVLERKFKGQCIGAMDVLFYVDWSGIASVIT